MIRTILALIISCQSMAQSLELDKVVPLKFVPEQSSIDQAGNVYMVTNKGLIVKYSFAGDSLLSFSPKKNSPISSIDARTGIRPFIFYKNFQEYAYLDQFITAASFHSFYSNLIGFAELVAISSDNNLWVLDADDFSIKKYNPLNNTLELVSPLNLILDEDDYEVDQMKEYQNILFLKVQNKGLYLFDNYGTLQKKVETNLSFINFYKDFIYFLKDGYIVFLNIYTGSKTGIPLPESTAPIQVLRNANKMYLIEQDHIRIYTIREDTKK